MTAKLTKGDLYFLLETLEPLRYPPARQLDAAQIVRLGEIVPKLRGLVELVRSRPERGRKIFEWRIHCAVAPTQNELNNWYARNRFRIGKAKDILRAQIQDLVAVHPEAALHGAQKRRWLRLTRFTSATTRVDEDRIDGIGGKLPVDMLKKCEVIVDDSKEWLERRAHVMKTKPGNTHVLVELFEMGEIEVPCADPQDGPAPPDPRQRRSKVAGLLGGTPSTP